MKPRGKQLSPERKELLAQLVEDRWPIRQMILTHGFYARTIKKHYPNYHCGMTQKEAGELGQALRRIKT